MSSILVDANASDEARREQAYAGTLFFYTPTAASRALCEHAWDLIAEAFSPLDPIEAQEQLSVEKYAEVIGPMKTEFTHHIRSKELIRDYLVDLGADPEKTYFDIPRMRVVTHSAFLTSGVGYAYNAHRDIWYAAPPCQLNWWLPITDIGSQSALAFHPVQWDEPTPNSSEGFDAYEWNAVGRAEAAKHVKSDTRNHPVPVGQVNLEPTVRIVGPAASSILFSAAQLHSTVPNTSGRTRFSLDFRTVNLDDLVGRIGAPNIDNSSTGTTARDFLRASDFERLPDDVVALYDHGSTHEGPLVFDPSAVA